MYDFFPKCKKKCIFAAQKITILKHQSTMKKLSIIVMCFVSLALVSCGSSLGSANSSTTSAAKSNGRAAGTSIITLYNSYRSTGTVNLGNPTDLTAALSLATAYTNFRTNQADANYKKAFAAGMVAAGAGLITANNVGNIINTMNNLTGLNVNAATITNNIGTATAIIQLLQALGSAQQ